MLLWAMMGLTAKTSAVAGGARLFARARSSGIRVGRYQRAGAVTAKRKGYSFGVPNTTNGTSPSPSSVVPPGPLVVSPPVHASW